MDSRPVLPSSDQFLYIRLPKQLSDNGRKKLNQFISFYSLKIICRIISHFKFVHSIDAAQILLYNIDILIEGVMKMSDTTNLSIRIDRSLKDEADQIFNEMGMNLTTAITIFVRQAVRQKKIPFEIALDASYPTHIRNVSLADARAAVERIWENAEQNGTADMSMEDINAEIKAARAERRANKTGKVSV